METPAFVERVVNKCLRIREEDRVCIFTWKHTLDLAEALAYECQRLGAKTHVEVETDQLYYQSVLDLPLKRLQEANPFSLSLLDIATANIFISGPENPDDLRKITPERMSAIVEGDKPFSSKFLEKRIRSANIYLGHVTRQRARTYGFDYEKWDENVQAAIDVDYDFVQGSGRRIARMLEKASSIHVTAENGTDLTLELWSSMPKIDDGIVDDEDIRRGAVLTTLPAGNVAVIPREGSANGMFISNVPEADSGLLIHDMRWEFKKGRLMSFTGGKNSEIIKKRWQAAKGSHDQASWLMIGLNPKAEGGYLYNNIVLGSVSLGLGDNRELGGRVESDFGAHCTILKPNVELDERFIIRNGKLSV